MMQLIDFDEKFQHYIEAWYEAHRREMTVEQMELLVPGLYEEWLAAPADWLEGAAPADYFTGREPRLLVEWMLDYMAGGVGIPGPLQDAVMDGDTAPYLKALLSETAELPPRADRSTVRMQALGLLLEMENGLSLEELLGLAAGRTKREDELADTAAEGLAAFGQAAVEPVLAAMDRPISDWARISLADVLTNYPGDGRITQWLLRLYREHPAQRTLFAAYLGKYGDTEALPLLEEEIQNLTLGYMDYLEVKNAIEALGGTVETEREFAYDADYEALSKEEK